MTPEEGVPFAVALVWMCRVKIQITKFNMIWLASDGYFARFDVEGCRFCGTVSAVSNKKGL